MIQDDLISILQRYGLDQVLTDQDDPRLWATVVDMLWPHPDDPHLVDPIPHDRPMNDDLISVLQYDGIDQVLTDQHSIYGLDNALTDQDEPLLRDRPINDTLQFIFGVGRIPVKSDGSRNLSGIEIDEQWTFERIDDHHFKAIRGDPEHTLFNAHFILDISHPSTGTNIAWVHAGSSPSPLAGKGVTVVWVRKEDGSWIETQEVVDAWIS